MAVGIRNVQLVARRGQSSRLFESTRLAGDLSRGWIHLPDLAIVCVGNVKHAIAIDNTQWMLHASFVARTIDVSEFEQSHADKRLHFAVSAGGYAANRTGFTVGNV